MAAGNVHNKFGENRLCSFPVMQADRQTNGQTHHNTSHPSRGQSND